jgi:hypothetical protein
MYLASTWIDMCINGDGKDIAFLRTERPLARSMSLGKMIAL